MTATATSMRQRRIKKLSVKLNTDLEWRDSNKSGLNMRKKGKD